MKTILDIMIVLFAALSGFCWLCGRPVTGGVNTDVMFSVLARFFMILFLVFLVWRFA